MVKIFRKQKEPKEDKNTMDWRIQDILNKEKVLKQGESNYGRIYLTENYFLWENKKESIIIPLRSIIEVNRAAKFGKGGGLEFTLDDKRKFFLPLVKGVVDLKWDKKAQEWFEAIAKVSPQVEAFQMFEGIDYLGGYTPYPKKLSGSLLLYEDKIVFQENKLRSSKVRFEIPLINITNVGVKRTSEVDVHRLAGLILGTWVQFSKEHKTFLIIEYNDEMGMKQNPIFDFPLDAGDKKKTKIAQLIYEKLKQLKSKESTQEKEEGTFKENEDPMKVLKLRLARGEITKEEYEERKKLLEES